MVRIRVGDEELSLAWEEWEARVRAGRVPPDALVNVPALTGAAFVPASSLESYQSLRSEALDAWQRDMRRGGGPPIVTALLIGVQIRVWWLFGGTSTALDLEPFEKRAPHVLENGEVWRLLTMGFTHTDTSHVALNMLWLAYTGWSLERALGRVNLVVVYVASVLVGSTLSMLGAPWTRSIGASGGVFGLLAAVVVFGLTRPELLPERSRRTYGYALLPYLLLMFWSGLRNAQTDNWAHGGGLLCGLLLGFLLDPEPLQRRPGWNLRVRLGVLGVAVAAVAAMAAFGPRLLPIVTLTHAEEKVSPPELRETIRKRDTSALPVLWEVPAGWYRATGVLGTTGWGSPAGDRLWAVREEVRDLPIELDALAEEWATRVRDTFPDAAFVGPEPARIGAFEGVRRAAIVPRGPRLEWHAAARGTRAIVAVWETDAEDADRLAPLRDRLLARIEWREPADLRDARDAVADAPKARRPRAELARALADAGEPEASLEIARALVAESPDALDGWLVLLRTTRLYPTHVPDAEALWSDALARQPSPDVIVEVVHGLEAAGRAETARGLLEVAWARSPGDRILARARRARGLSVELDPARHLPWDVTWDLGADRPRTDAEIATLLAEAPSLAAADARAARLRADEAALADRAARALAAGDPAAIEPLLRLRWRRAPADRAAAIGGVVEDLRTIAGGGAVAWVPDPVAAAVRQRLAADPGFLDRLAATP